MEDVSTPASTILEVSSVLATQAISWMPTVVTAQVR